MLSWNHGVPISGARRRRNPRGSASRSAGRREGLARDSPGRRPSPPAGQGCPLLTRKSGGPRRPPSLILYMRRQEGETCPRRIGGPNGPGGRFHSWQAAWLGTTLRHLRDLFRDGTAVGLGDGQLLARYAASHDGPAFAALVARHGPMVAATCRAVLQARARRRGRLPGHVPRPGPQGALGPCRRRPGRLAAPRGLSRAVQANIESRRRRRREAEASAMATLDAARHRARSRHRVHRARGDRPAAGAPSAAGGALRPGGPDLRAGRRAACTGPCRRSLPAGEGAAAAAGSPGPPRRDGGAVGAVLAGSTAGRRRSPRRWPARRSRRRRAGRLGRGRRLDARPSSGAMLMTKLKIAAAAVLARGRTRLGRGRRRRVGRPDPPGPAMIRRPAPR